MSIQTPSIYPSITTQASQSIISNIIDEPITELAGNIITNRILTLQNGTLTGISTATVGTPDNYAVNKEYVDSLYEYEPGGINGSITYNDNSVFGGSSNLTFSEEGSLGTITVNGSILSGTTSLSTGVLTGLADPMIDTQASTKKYIDLSQKKYVSTINSSVGISYSGTNVVNGIVIRTGLIVPQNTTLDVPISDILVRTMDTFPTATEIIARLNSLNITVKIGTTFTFSVYNQNNLSSASLIIKAPDNSITIDPENMTIFGSYSTNFVCIISNINVGHCIVKALSDSFVGQTDFISPGYNDPQWALQMKSVPTANIIRTNTQLLLPMNPISYDGNNSISYVYSDVASKLIIRNMTSNITDTFIDAAIFLNNEFFNISDKNMGMEFAIQNISGYSLTLTPGTGWTFVGTVVVQAGYTGIFVVVPDKNNTLCTLYSIDIMNRF